MRGRLMALSIAVVTMATLTVGVGTVVSLRSGAALPGVTIAGTSVSGQERGELRATVRQLADARTSGTLPVQADDVRATVPRSLLRIDVDATVEQALDAGRTGFPLARVFGPVFGTGERSVDLSLRTDDRGLEGFLDGLAKKVDRSTENGGFTVQSGAGAVTVRPQLPLAGRELQRAASRAALARALSTGAEGPVELPVSRDEPSATDAQIQAVVSAATAAVAQPYVLASGPAKLTLTPAELAPLLRSEAGSGGPKLGLDGAALTALITRKAGPLQTKPKDAGFEVAGTPATVDNKGDLTWTPKPAQVRVRPSTPGREVDVEAAVTSLTDLIGSGRYGPVPLPLRTAAAALTTEQAQAAGVTGLIGTFTTYFVAGQPRATNIRRIAEIVNGTYVPSGKVLSLNTAAGKRTTQRGFVADGAIVDGELTDEVGGGVSQFATTLFNASFFAGLPILEHKPHSFYISRYPAGRESTVYYGALDVRVRNDTAHGLYVRTRSTPGSVTVELYGDNGGRRVSSTSGPRKARPGGGFTIDVTRLTSGGDGQGGRRVFHTTYDPTPEH